MGLDEVMVRRSGKNLIHVTASEPLTFNGVAWTITDGVIHAQGTASITSRYVVAENVFLPRGTYSVNPAKNIYYELVSGNSVIVQTQRSFTLESDFTGNLQLYVLKGNTADVDIYPSIELGSTPTAYAPYTGTTVTLDLPSTVYGGEVDVATGQGQETYAMVELDGTEEWGAYSNNVTGDQQYEFMYTSEFPSIENGGGRICTHFRTGNLTYWNQLEDDMFATNGSYIRFQPSTIEALDDWKSYLAAQAEAGTPVTIAYKLATPQPITATGGQQINALAGVNTVMTDADGVTVTFLREDGNEQANVTGSFADSSDGYASTVSEMNEISISGEDVELTKLEIDYVPQVR